MPSKDRRTVLITGASSDIGLACCRLYLAAGYKLILQYRRMRPPLQALFDEAPDQVTLFQLDLADLSAVEAHLRENLSVVSTADVIIHLAADMAGKDLAHSDAETLTTAFNVNVIAPTLITNALVPFMRDRQWGRIVNGSSIGVKFGGGRNSYAYALSKHALEFFPAESRDWAGDNVFVNTIRIGVTETRLHDAIPGKKLEERAALIPAKRLAQPDEIARTIFFFGSDDNSFTSRQLIAVAGGE